MFFNHFQATVQTAFYLCIIHFSAHGSRTLKHLWKTCRKEKNPWLHFGSLKPAAVWLIQFKCLQEPAKWSGCFFPANFMYSYPKESCNAYPPLLFSFISDFTTNIPFTKIHTLLEESTHCNEAHFMKLFVTYCNHFPICS